MLIDSHQHFWKIADRQGQWPPAELAAIHRDFGPADLQSTLERCGIDGTVLVQSLPDVRDTEFMLRLASQHPFVLGVVGWVDMKSAGAVASHARPPWGDDAGRRVGRGQPGQDAHRATPDLHGGEVAVAGQRDMANLRIGHGAAVGLDVEHPVTHRPQRIHLSDAAWSGT